MQPPTDVIRGVLKIDNLPDLACKQINSFADAIRALPQFATVEVPAGFSGVISGASEPTEDDLDKIWSRRDNNGTWIGFYVFTAGSWKPAFFFPDGHIEWLAIDSRTPPDGFTLIDGTGPSYIPSSVRTALMTYYVPDSGSTYYLYAAYSFEGY